MRVLYAITNTEWAYVYICQWIWPDPLSFLTAQTHRPDAAIITHTLHRPATVSQFRPMPFVRAELTQVPFGTRGHKT